MKNQPAHQPALPMRYVLLVGFGFLGQEVYRRLLREHAEVYVITDNRAHADAAEADGLMTAVVDIGDLAALRTVRPEFRGFPMDRIIHCASTRGGGVEAYRRVYREGVGNLLEVFPGSPLLFTSSTSVYGQTSGEWVTESSLAQPGTESGQVLREAEDLVLGAGGIVARLAALYAPGRWAQLERLGAGTATLAGGGERWQNHIHRDDAAAALVTLTIRGEAGTIYNVADDTPLRQREVFAVMCETMGRPLPPSAPDDPLRKRGLTSKRVSNARLRGLGWVPRYPSIGEAISRV